MIHVDKLGATFVVPFKCKVEITVTLYNKDETSLKTYLAGENGLYEVTFEEFLKIKGQEISCLQELVVIYKELQEGFDVYRDLVRKIKTIGH